MIYVGIDPDLGGALAVLNEDGTILSVHDCPTSVVSGQRRMYDLGSIHELCGRWIYGRAAKVAIEEQAAMSPGRIACFSLGAGWAAWGMAVISWGAALHRVAPKQWRAMHRLKNGKDQSLIRVREMHPESRELFSLVQYHGRADAVLIAEYLRRVTR